jgi:hypothetical protein
LLTVDPKEYNFEISGDIYGRLSKVNVAFFYKAGHSTSSNTDLS